jgi:predicted DNA-binding transcriptional regulator YafY
MDQIERIYKIDQLLTSRGVVSTAMFLEELEISLATFKRDKEYMQSRLHAPLVYDRLEGGYRLEKGSQIGPAYELPGIWFSEQELHALLTTQQLLDNLEPGLLTPYVEPLRNKIKSILGSINDSADEIARRVRVFAVGRRKIELRHFSVIAMATVRRQRLKLTHYRRVSDTHLEREISPQQLVYYRDNWYLDSWCHLRNDIRSFAVDAIESAQMLDAAAKEISLPSLQATLGKSYGIFSGTNVQWAKLRITPEKARWVSRIVWHSEQKVKFDDEGYYLLDIPFSDHRELVNDILGMLPEVEVLAPESLKNRILEVLKLSMDSIYGSNVEMNCDETEVSEVNRITTN